MGLKQIMKYNPNLQEKFKSNTKQETNRQAMKEDKTSAKEIAEAFSANTGQEISKEEVSLIQDIQLTEDEVKDPDEDIETSEGDTMET